MSRLPLKSRYALVLLSMTLATVASLAAALLIEFGLTAEQLRESTARSMDRALMQQYERRATDLARTLSENLSNSVYLLDVDEIGYIVQRLSDLPDINAVAVFDKKGLLYQAGAIPGVSLRELSSHSPGPDFFAEMATVMEILTDNVTVSAPVLLAEKSVGHVMVNVSLTPINREIAALRREHTDLVGEGVWTGLMTALAITLAFGAVSIALAVGVGNRFSRPINQLSQFARLIGRGEYHMPEAIEGGDEVRELVEAFAKMAEELGHTTVSKTYLDNILHGMLDGLLVAGPEGTIRTINAACGRLLGYEEKELLGQTVSSVIDAPVSDLSDIALSRPREGVAYRKSGDRFPVLVSSAELPGQPREDICSVWVFRDITSMKAAQSALVTAMQEAEQANRAKSRFLANMSHELRTPLNAIIGYSEMLQEDLIEAGQTDLNDDLKRINSAGQHLLGLINEVLDLSKIEAGKMTVAPVEFNLAHVIDEACTTVKHLVERHGNRLTASVPENLPPMHSDPVKLRQILFNILSNAAKFTRDGEIGLTVYLSGNGMRDRMEITVTDTGIGMTEDQIGSVFGEFLQADSSTTREYGGTGLGLTISRHMAHMLKGDISVVSKPGEGSAFTLNLPLRLTAHGDSGAKQPRSSPTRPTEVSARENTVLFVSSDLELVKTLAGRMDSWGFRTVTALSGSEGLRRARELRPAAVIVDETLPDMDAQNIRKVLTDDVRFGAPRTILAVSPGIEVEGASVAKPVDSEVLFDILAAGLPRNDGRTAMVIDADRSERGDIASALRTSGWKTIEAASPAEGLDAFRGSQPELIVIDLTAPKHEDAIFLEAVRATPNGRRVEIIALTLTGATLAPFNIHENRNIILCKDDDGWIHAVRVLGSTISSSAVSEPA